MDVNSNSGAATNAGTMATGSLGLSTLKARCAAGGTSKAARGSGFGSVGMSFSASAGMNRNKGSALGMRGKASIKGRANGGGNTVVKLTMSRDNGVCTDCSGNGARLLKRVTITRFTGTSNLRGVNSGYCRAALGSNRFSNINMTISTSKDGVGSKRLRVSGISLSKRFASVVVARHKFRTGSHIVAISSALLRRLVGLGE